MENKTVLLIDDDEDYIYQQKLLLEKDGFNVVIGESKNKAIEILDGGLKPDCAILDLMMEDMDAGFVLANHIKNIDQNIPVIIITAVTSETGLEFTSDCQNNKIWIKADVMLAKPIRYEQLKKEMERLLK